MTITESPSLYNDLESLSTFELLTCINEQDQTVAANIKNIVPQISALIDTIVDRMQNNGRLFYVGAGTSGRLGILDAAECPPTYGVSPDKVIGLIAGGTAAIQHAIEFAEDDEHQAQLDLQYYDITADDTVVGLSASGATPYVVSAVRYAKENKCLTSCITCNPNTNLSASVDHPLEIIVGPEFVTGSTRMKAGTAQKLILNMISTSVMIKLGHVKGNQMVDMQLNNQKLVERGTKMLMDILNIDADSAKALLEKHGSVRKVLCILS